MTKNNSTSMVVLALSVNLFISIVKFFIWGLTGSSAFFSEGVHSLVDSINQGMLWYGQKKSYAGPDARYPLGRGKEEYFWALVVAVVFFTLGGVVSIQHGVEALKHPRVLENLPVSIFVLVISIFLETYVLIRAIKVLKHKKKAGKTILRLLKESTEGSLIALIVEDFAATLGLFIALVGVSTAYFTGNSIFDGLSSIFIGILLMGSGLFLGFEMKHLIVGESVNNDTKISIRNLILSNSSVKEVKNLQVVIIGNNKYLVLGDIDYIDELDDRAISEANKQITQDLKSRESSVAQVFLNTV